MIWLSWKRGMQNSSRKSMMNPRRPLPDQTHLTDLKRRKLQIKEQIERMSGVNSPA